MWDVGLGDFISISAFSERREYPILLGPPNVFSSSINYGILLGILVGEMGYICQTS